MTTLSAQQSAAVHTDAPRALVLAGAGSGKTRVLTERIATLIEQRGASPYEICAFTFTRKAAGEMRDRLERRIGPAANHVTMGTMHAVALERLKRHGEMIGLRPQALTVYNEWETGFLLRDVCTEIGALKGSAWKIKKGDIDAMFSAYYATGQEPPLDDPAYPVFRAFLARCHENNALTYGALLTGLRLLLPRIKSFLGYKYVLVDEVQDLDPLQWLLVNDLCAATGAELFVVGDVDQSIFEWRGACPEYLLEHAEEFAVYPMEANYRSAALVVAAANNLIARNRHRIHKTMTAARPSGPSVQVAKDLDSAGVARFVSSLLLDDNNAPESCAVLARNHGLLRKLSQEFKKRGVPHTYVGEKTALSNREEFRRFVSVLKLLVNPYDNFAFLLAFEALGLDRLGYRALREDAVRAGRSHYQEWLNGADGAAVASDMKAITKSGSLHDALERAQDMAWPFNPEPLAEEIESWAADRPDAKITAYLDWLATVDVQDEIPADSQGVTLATVHAAKGLEWPVVIVAGCNEDILPSKQAIASGDIEAERRLAYVAWTRAEDMLVLAVRPVMTVKPLRNGKTRTYMNPASRFIGESGLGDIQQSLTA